LLFDFWSGNHQSLAHQQPFCVHYVIKALATKATIQSLVPHFQLCPSSTDRTVTESGISCLDDRIIHMQRRSVHLNPAGLILGEQKVCSICNAIPSVCRSLTMNQSISTLRCVFAYLPALSFFSELISDHSRINSNLIVMISSVNNRSGSAPRLYQLRNR
jgi:hypothetical protein